MDSQAFDDFTTCRDQVLGIALLSPTVAPNTHPFAAKSPVLLAKLLQTPCQQQKGHGSHALGDSPCRALGESARHAIMRCPVQPGISMVVQIHNHGRQPAMMCPRVVQDPPQRSRFHMLPWESLAKYVYDTLPKLWFAPLLAKSPGTWRLVLLDVLNVQKYYSSILILLVCSAFAVKQPCFGRVSFQSRIQLLECLMAPSAPDRLQELHLSFGVFGNSGSCHGRPH